MNNKYAYTDHDVTYTAFGYLSFHIDPHTHEVIGLNEEDYPRLVDKWLKSGKIVEMEPEVEVEEEVTVEEEEPEDFDTPDLDDESSGES